MRSIFDILGLLKSSHTQAKTSHENLILWSLLPKKKQTTAFSQTFSSSEFEGDHCMMVGHQELYKSVLQVRPEIHW